ncbi:hypothetical protein RJ641_019191 [Dillenia turbinata]|uniref:Pentatricopeptide repeat-containing protein n=1 Tax=Dillenia turbinata TaxID=194707 RepID=A0AAN8UJ14_9MAGN
MIWCHHVQLLESCIQSKSLTLGKQIHQAIIKDNTHFNNFTVLENLIYLYVKCDQILYARRVAYAWNGPFEEAIYLYHLMLRSGFKSTKSTYPFVLKACSSLQAVEDDMDIHNHVSFMGLSHTSIFLLLLLISMLNVGIWLRQSEFLIV